MDPLEVYKNEYCRSDSQNNYTHMCIHTWKRTQAYRVRGVRADVKRNFNCRYAGPQLFTRVVMFMFSFMPLPVARLRHTHTHKHDDWQASKQQQWQERKRKAKETRRKQEPKRTQDFCCCAVAKNAARVRACVCVHVCATRVAQCGVL